MIKIKKYLKQKIKSSLSQARDSIEVKALVLHEVDPSSAQGTSMNSCSNTTRRDQ